MNDESSLRLASLHPQYKMKDVDLHGMVDIVRTKGPKALPNNIDSKSRRNAIAAVCIEKMWRVVEQAESESPDTFGLPEGSIGTLGAIGGQNDLPVTINHLSKDTETHLLQCMDSFAEDAGTEVDRLRITKLLHRGKHTPMYPDRIHAGLLNGNSVNWQSLHVLPHVFQRELGEKKTLTAVLYRELAERNIAFIRNMARSHLSIFGVANGIYSPSSRFPIFAPEMLTMTGKGAHLRMDISEKIKLGIEVYRRDMKHTVATGCPALFAKASNGKDVVSAMYDWSLRIADRVFFPHVESILERSNLGGSAGEMAEHFDTLTEELTSLLQGMNSVSSS